MIINNTWATICGILHAMLIVALLNPPSVVPEWVIWLLTSFAAGVSAASGITHPGIRKGKNGQNHSTKSTPL